MLPIISASRRTDLVRCYPELLAKWLNQGYVKVKNPYNQQERLVDLTPNKVHSLVLWSKDYSRLLNNEYGLRDLVNNYGQCFIHFTITGLGGTPLEPGVLPSSHTVEQFSQLIKLVKDPRRILWRFDPIVFWREERKIKSNLTFFNTIAAHAQTAGLTQVMVSLGHWYQKSIRRARRYNLDWIQEKTSSVKRIATWLNHQAQSFGLKVLACSQDNLVTAGLGSGRCIDGHLLNTLHPDQCLASIKSDQGQRSSCGCTRSTDIGSYDLSCPQGCIYCYANPK